jgi:flagellar M-ring protein FliF
MEKFKESFSKNFNNAKEKWLGIAAKTRTIILAVAGVILVSAIIITVVLNRPQQSVLCVAANAGEVIEIQQALASVGIVDGVSVTRNNEIIVPDHQRGAAMVALSERGLPTRGQNNDVWNHAIGMFSTNMELNEAKKFQYQQWIIDYLSEIPQVASARVVLCIPHSKNYVMVENRSEARASVAVNLHPGQALSKQQINGIYSFVRNSIEGLEERNISVNDGNSIPLIPGDADAGDEIWLMQQRFNLEVGFRQLVASDAVETLIPFMNRVVGEEDYALTVNADLDTRDDYNVEEVEYTPVVGFDAGIMRNVAEHWVFGYTSEDGLPVGSFVDVNIAPDYPTLNDIQAGSEVFGEWQRNINYEINERRTSYKEAGLRIKKMSASLVLNSPPLTAAAEENWQNLIANAIGAEPENITIMTQIFPPRPTTPVQPGQRPSDAIRSTLIWIIIALGILLVALLILAILTSGRKKRHIRYRGAVPVSDGTGYLRDDSYQPIPTEPEGFDLPSLLDENETKDVVLKREIKEFSKSNPEIIAQLIRTWFREEDV